MTAKDHTFEDCTYQIQRSGAYAIAKEGIFSFLPSIITAITSGAIAFSVGNPPFLLLVGAMAAVSAVLTMNDSNQRLDCLAEDYAEEIAAKLGINPKDVTRKHLELVARGDPSRGIPPNQVLAQHLEKENKSLIFNIFISIAATIASIAAVNIFAGQLSWLAHSVGDNIGHWAQALVKPICSVLAYTGIKWPLHMVAEMALGEDKTAAEKIKIIGDNVVKGQQISRERILDVYVSSNEEIASRIKEGYGKSWHNLSPGQREELASRLDRELPLSQLAQAVSQRVICATELAFSVQGDVSGVAPGSWQAPEMSPLEKMLSNIGQMFSPCNKKNLSCQAPILPYNNGSTEMARS